MLLAAAATTASAARTHPGGSVPGAASSRRSLIVNGKAVDVSDFPFYGSLRVSKGPNLADLTAVIQTLLAGGGAPALPPTQLPASETMHNCGASLVAPNIALTAAHCVHDDDGQLMPVAGLSVAFGSNSYFARDAGAELVPVRLIVAHPEYQPAVDPDMQVYSQFANDLALLVLERPSSVGQVIEFATLDTDAAPGEAAEVVGWGNTVQAPVDIRRASHAPKRLQHTDLSIIGNHKCDAFSKFMMRRGASMAQAAMHQFKEELVQSLDKFPDFKEFMEKTLDGQLSNVDASLGNQMYQLEAAEITDTSKICAEDVSPINFSGVCNGDSGGPLFVRREGGRPLLVGAASYVQGCGAGLPDTYARVAPWADFIAGAVEEYGIVDTTSTPTSTPTGQDEAEP